MNLLMKSWIYLESWCNMKKYKYNIIGLDCPNCARSLEENLNKNKNLENVIINFNTKKISYSSDSITLSELNKLISKYEPDAKVIENEIETKKEYHLSLLILGILLGLVGLYLNINKIINTILLISSFIILLYKPFITGVKILVKSKTINENALIVISVVGAYIVGEEVEGIMVVSLYLLGKILEEKALNNSRKSIAYLMDIKQDYGNVLVNEKIIKTDVDKIKIGDTLVIKKGERIPLDGVITKGSTSLDLKSLTGESELVNVKEKDIILSGSINTENVIEVKVTSLYKDSMVAKILELISDASDKKAKTETLVSKISKFYTPVVLIIAIIVGIALPLITNISYSDAIYRALTFLVISCPCAIAISVPLSYFTGIGVSSKNGILIKGSNYLDNLSHINKMVFDKTGTLTDGVFEVSDIKINDSNYTKDEIIKILCKGESLSNHPIALSILKLSNKEVNNNDVKDYKEIAGQGITYTLSNKHIKIGNKELCNCNEESDIHLNIDGRHIASIFIKDGIKEHALDCINYLKKEKIKTFMFTGDRKEIAYSIGKKLNIDEIHAELLPTDKYKLLESLTNKDEIVAFVGDGINDTPVLKRADIGIAMGAVGASSAIEASDIVIMKDDLDKIIKSIQISKYTKKIIIENLIFALFIKVSILTLSVLGIASMWFAVFADTGVTLLTILNTLRILKKFK